MKSGTLLAKVEWLIGHDISIAKHYLADNIKNEYNKGIVPLKTGPLAKI